MPPKNKSIKSRFLRWIHSIQLAYLRLTHSSRRSISIISTILLIASVICSIGCLINLTIHAGFEHSAHDYVILNRFMRWIQGVFIANVAFNLIFNTRITLRDTRWVKWIVDIAILITLLPWIYPHPKNPWIPWLEVMLYSHTFIYIVMTAYSVVTLSYALFRMLGHRTNPSLLMSASFLVFIIIGSFMLMLPKCTYHGISYIDSLFVSTSAVSITGLTCVDIPSTFTPLGQLILAILIQIGALGVMTFTSFFALFFSGNASIFSQLMLKDMVYSKSMSSLLPTLLYILAFTIAVEVAGALMLFLSIHDTIPAMTTGQEISFAAFHSISAFCNAGFSTLPDGLSNPILLHHNISIYWIMSLLIVSGSLGFPILVNFRDALAARIRNFINARRRHPYRIPRQVHLFNMNTKIVLATFTLLFAAGAILFFILEYNNTLSGMTLWQKITQSVFNSATPRSAGFVSVNPASFLNATLVIMLFLMWVGGASQSTGGGIKVNTLAAIWFNLRAVVTGAPRVTAFRRQISIGSIRRANAVVALSILSYLIISLILLWLEPELPARSLLYESLSALFTVGSSLGITSSLSPSSLILLSVAMFVGRVGLISLLAGFARRSYATGVHFPSENIIIN